MSYSEEERLYYLLKVYTDHTATEAEEKELFEWAMMAEDDHVLKNHIFQLLGTKNEISFTEVDWERMFQSVIKKIKREKPAIRKWVWYKVAAAVAVLLMASGGLFLITNKEKKGDLIKHRLASESMFKNDVKPGGTKAILQAGNQQVRLNANDTSFTLGGNHVQIQNGALTVGNIAPVQYVLTTPLGGTYSVMLSDGTKVWLNAGSELRYPSLFQGGTRTVSLSGEAYFEVATDVNHPFIVKTSGQDIKVLGTEFNVEAYTDDAEIITSLIKGKVQVEAGGKNLVLDPGQQSLWNKQDRLDINPDADIAQAVAWKNGYFRFDKADIQSIMTQLARWYNIRVVYEPGLKNQYFGAIMNRNNNISQILDMLSATGEIHFKVEGNVVMVKQ
ncbi:MAG: FecR family protein [Chitinophagaceae bacterium]|nr:MAG: FecR family protein [Chitinophagaceae bacterium]